MVMDNNDATDTNTQTTKTQIHKKDKYQVKTTRSQKTMTKDIFFPVI